MDLIDDVVVEVKRRLGVRLDRTATATGAWAESAGHRTDRRTWSGWTPGWTVVSSRSPGSAPKPPR